MNPSARGELLCELYERSVQDPPQTVRLVTEMYENIFQSTPLRLREDFCGSFAVGREWVRSLEERTALGIDISAKTLAQAKRRIRRDLDPGQHRRIQLKRSDVRVRTPKSDIILAENFSFFALKDRAALVAYFKAAAASLSKNGALMLDMIGGREFTHTPRVEQRRIKVESPRRGLPETFTYYWRQKRFDPSSGLSLYAIDFKVRQRLIRDAFVYDWRVWSLPEVRDCLSEAGFGEVILFWEDDDKDPTRLRRVTEVSNYWDTWACTVVAHAPR